MTFFIFIHVTARREQLCSEIESTGGFIIDPDGSGPLDAITVECEVDGGCNIYVSFALDVFQCLNLVTVFAFTKHTWRWRKTEQLYLIGQFGTVMLQYDPMLQYVSMLWYGPMWQYGLMWQYCSMLHCSLMVQCSPMWQHCPTL